MKRVFAVIIVLVLAIGMIGLFFASFLQGGTTAGTVTSPSVTETTVPVTNTAPAQ